MCLGNVLWQLVEAMLDKDHPRWATKCGYSTIPRFMGSLFETHPSQLLKAPCWFFLSQFPFVAELLVAVLTPLEL